MADSDQTDIDLLTTSEAIIAVEAQHTSGVYTKRQVAIERGAGAILWDADGNEYIDCVGGQGSANLGHANPSIAQAITEQAQKLISCPEMFYNSQRAQFTAHLAKLSGLDRVFLCNSGTEAIEAGIKFSRYLTGRTGVVAAMRGFHGRTYGALSATWEKKYRAPFEPLVSGFTHAPFNDLPAISDLINDQTAAVILEIVQGEGGVHLANEDFLIGVQEICRQRGAMLIIDEVQTGFGRTGFLFAYQRYGLKPDIVCLAKSMAGGLPMGATLLHERWGALPPAVHGSTFGGNPLVCAAANAALQFILEHNLPQRSEELGRLFREQLRSIQSPLVREVRGLGLMNGIELKQKVAPYIAELMKLGVLVLPAGLSVIRFLPPLVISSEQIGKVTTAVNQVLNRGVVQ
jgi:LysW-gamma-L-lysine/LysW-L-ornithine aminotransferase